jgi:hypothetical protein
MKLGQPLDLHLATRYYQFNRSFAIRDVFDALVELITNSDDSYHRLFKKGMRPDDGGQILIEYLRQLRSNSAIIVHDRAEGMTLEEMRDRLGDVGTRRSEEGDRGFMARGAKDCTELGPLTIESIKEERYYKCQLTTKPQFIPLEDRKVTTDIRQRLNIKRGNGTVVMLEVEPKHTMPLFESIIRDLPWHFALRDILSEDSPAKVLIKNMNQPHSSAEKLRYIQPAGNLVCDETFDVPDYNGVKATLKIWQSREPFEDTPARFRRAGIVIKAQRAIHECGLLLPEFERDQLAKKYFGRLECSHIDTLLTEYDERREQQLAQPSNNPSLLIDPSRQQGLIPEHPFTKALFLLPSEWLRALIAKDREAERSKQKHIANEETQNRLDRLAKKASDFLKRQLDELEDISKDDDVDKSAFAKHGVLIFPTYLNVGIGQERVLTYYVKRSLLHEQPKQVSIEVDDTALTVSGAPFELKPHRAKDDRLVGTFTVRGESLKDGVIIRAICEGLSTAEAIACVVDTTIEERVFESPLEFEYENYRVREGSKRSLELFAKYPEVVAGPTSVTVISSDTAALPIRGTCELVPVAGSNYARGIVTVQGRKLNAKAQVKATANGRDAVTHVKVVQKPEEQGVAFKFELRDEDFGNFRAMWADHESKPNLLLISTRHPSIQRYLGPAPTYEGQNELHFRVLLAEIIAEAVCSKSLELESKERTWEFRWADLKEDHLIANSVRASLQQRLRTFVGDAHAIMLSSVEVAKAAKA